MVFYYICLIYRMSAYEPPCENLPIFNSNAFICSSSTTAGSGGDGLPTGSMITFAGNGTLPLGYLKCDGQLVSATTFSVLYASIGNAYGGNATNFNVPDMTDKFIRGSTTSVGTITGQDSFLVDKTNIQAFTPDLPVGFPQQPIVFTSPSGIANWNYLKGQPAGDGSVNKWLPQANSDSANGANLTSALAIGDVAPTPIDNKPISYAMIYIIKT